jgi:hypothetical protein
MWQGQPRDGCEGNRQQADDEEWDAKAIRSQQSANHRAYNPPAKVGIMSMSPGHENFRPQDCLYTQHALEVSVCVI